MQIEISYNENKALVKNCISYQQAQELKHIADLKALYEKQKETARYLYGKKRGAWGRMTMADEKRSNKLDDLKRNLDYRQMTYNNKYSLNP